MKDATTTDLAEVCNTLAMATTPLRLRALRFLSTASAPAPLHALLSACDLSSTGTLSLQLDLLRHARLVEAVSAKAKAGPTLYRLTVRGRDLVAAVARLERGIA